MSAKITLQAFFVGLFLSVIATQGWANDPLVTGVLQITDNNYKDTQPQISGKNKVWQGKVDGADYEIFFNDGKVTTQLTDNDSNDIAPQVSGNQVVWQGLTANDPNDPNNVDWEIFYDDGHETLQLTDNSYDDIRPQISGNIVVWQGRAFDPNHPNSHDWEIFAYVDGRIIQVTDNHTNDSFPQVSRHRIVWQGRDDHSMEIFTANIGKPLHFKMKFTPQSLNVHSKGKYVQVKISIPKEIDPQSVTLDSLLLNKTLSPIHCKISGRRVKCKFNRSDVADLLKTGTHVKVTVTGELENGRHFKATDTIKVIDKGGKKNHPHPHGQNNHPNQGHN